MVGFFKIHGAAVFMKMHLLHKDENTAGYGHDQPNLHGQK
jgi:hypothetical protein